MRPLSLKLVLVLAGLLSTPLPAEAGKAPAGIVLKTEWAQNHSDLVPDPVALFGRLPNGMGYIIYKNATPRGTALIHLRIGAGSLMEDEDLSPISWSTWRSMARKTFRWTS